MVKKRKETKKIEEGKNGTKGGGKKRIELREEREREDRNYESRNEGKIDEDAEDEKDDDAARPSDSTGRPPC